LANPHNILGVPPRVSENGSGTIFGHCLRANHLRLCVFGRLNIPNLGRNLKKNRPLFVDQRPEILTLPAS
jgi:hypothetical protein